MMIASASNSLSAALRSRALKASLSLIQVRCSSQLCASGDVHDRTTHREYFLRQLKKDNSLRNSMAYSLSFADDEMAFEILNSMKDERMEEQLRISSNQLRRVNKPNQPLDCAPLPRTFREVRNPTSRAIVVTENKMPFSIVEVNQSWEGLCGYGYKESFGKSLGAFLQGPETDVASVTAMMSQLLRGEEAGIVVTNYTKEGRRFRNRLRVGPLVDEFGETTHFVGVLQEIQDGM